jgi:hypothetical protein
MGGDCHRVGTTGGVILKRENAYEIIVTDVDDIENKGQNFIIRFDLTPNFPPGMLFFNLSCSYSGRQCQVSSHQPRK